MANLNSGLTSAQMIAALQGGLNAITEAELETALALKADSSDLTAEASLRTAADNKQIAALAELIDSGAKNKLEMTQTQTSIEHYGVTATYDSATGTVTLTGSHVSTDSGAIFEFYAGNASDQRVLPAGTYHLSGVPSGGSTSTYRGALTSITGALDTGNGADFTLSSPQYAAYRILVSGNVNFGTNGMIFRPMVCTKAAWDISQEFVKYRPSIDELYAMILEL